MKFVTPKILEKLQGKTGEVLETTGRILLVKTHLENTTYVYTVWNPEENFHFVNTFSESEARETFAKYKGN